MEFLDKLIEQLMEELSSIFENWQMIVWQLLATVVLFLVIRFLLWKPITNYLEKRQEALNKELYETKYEKERLQQLKQETVKEYELVKTEAQEIKKALSLEAQEEKEHIIAEARLEAKRRLDQVELDIQQEIRESNDKIKKMIKEVAFSAAEKIVQHEIDGDTYDAMLEELIDESLY
ncbi:ATP synthase F(0) sector subunit b [Alteracholeplasma palmae J233]|uniref:ATP synthase subunit b n=1 Tax=Alteracholeplasma palmae (strain ATCC 49389 / J233) TaxID=1318466 RepID=U4KLI6_ALTPJ|nr:F0F1 ATP synthase subunit B [Alteracholeplasma palmae]CCV64814.1 ATP synthase F(0) sector subunit b [Alteracholeplasma palmae J233]